MEVRKYQPKYLTALQVLYLESRQNTFHWADADAFKLSDFDQDTEGEQVWVAVSGEKLLGFVSVWEPDSFIHHLYVSPQTLRSGAGSALLNTCKQHYSDLTLKCLTANENAIGFYRSQGFVISTTKGVGLDCYHLMTYQAE
ncbi:GNAT family N-acetyltransferase [Vibrio sp. 10N.261.46.E12]|uniref:GNAT family N-acetyltransferase n=1 Tax=unclassified Vibrio TaxID=2614977 RepID=UPI000976E976|nr:MULTISPECIES: GNAT family N-acetyltransferase [unclassified Vibrio]OMO38204.1 GNAT family N-acetyltransferase [Vibrio sp. 10N.261.45.E1]PMJ21296.1 GNAT family N-acetyltransferase [Vibrio sp. 10N.286.45.B6]PML84535.1 GNAT family N-acetyltransferase [Vibrio sp. 10N.261.49.E11]PMM64412.1 GNAT family N-acetyltransferase [Vibrio sp. 10N.261.46.F12]PMM78840.1 GNAT family N-acetyltransferase [Vibrio sp. 10N.261.46.E8]